MNKAIRLLAFDLDGTLYNTDDYFRLAFPKIAVWAQRRYGLRPARSRPLLWKILRQKGSTYHHLFDDFLEASGLAGRLTPEACRKAIQGMVRLFHAIPLRGLRPYPDIRVLSRLAKSYRIAILTHGSQAKQENKIRRFRLERLADPILYAADLGYGKPDPRVYKLLLRAGPYHPSQVLVIGDNPFMDFPGAQLLGMKTCRIARGEFRKLAYPCDYTVKNLYQLEKILQKQQLQMKKSPGSRR